MNMIFLQTQLILLVIHKFQHMRKQSKISHLEDTTLLENFDDYKQQSLALTNLKLILLMLFTYGIIVAVYYMSLAIQRVVGGFNLSYETGGGIILGIFGVYLIFFGTCWFCNSKKRQRLRRDVVQKAISKEKDYQAKHNFQ